MSHLEALEKGWSKSPRSMVLSEDIICGVIFHYFLKSSFIELYREATELAMCQT